MQIKKLDIDGLAVLQPKRFSDDRGYLQETFRDEFFREQVSGSPVVQENESLSIAIGTVRGLHFQKEPFEQGKLVRCVSGAIFDVAVDIRPDSATFGKWVGYELVAERTEFFWIPPGFAHGFMTLAANTVVNYKLTAKYSPSHEGSIRWDDPDISVEWPSTNSISLSDKDRDAPSFASFVSRLAETNKGDL